MAETCSDQQDAQDAGQEPRSKDKNSEGEEPEAQDPADNVPVAMQIQEQRGQGLQLTFVEYRQEICAAQEHQGSDLALAYSGT